MYVNFIINGVMDFDILDVEPSVALMNKMNLFILFIRVILGLVILLNFVVVHQPNYKLS